MKTLDEIRSELSKVILEKDGGIMYYYADAIESFAINHFKTLPYLNRLCDDICKLRAVTSDECFEIDDEFNYNDLEEEYRESDKKINYNKTLENILKLYPDSIVYYPYDKTELESKTIFNDSFIYNNHIFYMNTPEMPKQFYDCIVKEKYKPQIRWVLRDNHGRIQQKYMDVDKMEDISGNYNDGFVEVDKKICDIIHKDESSIIILHGKPGTGKSSYIRNLIYKNSDVNFYWLDSSMFLYIDSSEFIGFISTCKNAVFILEDSECLLKSREGDSNIAMQTLLNISDGILGDSLKLKFICTFNTNLDNLDKAILRKGRLKMKYEFKDLKKDKVEKIFEKLGIDKSFASDMPLCDVYNVLDDNGNNTTKNKIGF